MSSFLIVHVSDLYSMTLHISVFIIRFLSFPLRKIHWNTNEDMKLLTQHGECLWWIDPKQFYHWRMHWIHLLWTTLPSYVPLLQKELRLIPVHQGLPQNTPNIIQTTILWHSFKHPHNQETPAIQNVLRTLNILNSGAMQPKVFKLSIVLFSLVMNCQE